VATEIGIFENHDGRFCLTITDTDDRTYALFEERELQGGGYTWEGIVEALVRMRMPDELPRLSIGAEADNMHIYCDERAPLERVAALVREAVTDHALLIAAIEAAGPDLE
jgi:hypothetical protein